MILAEEPDLIVFTGDNIYRHEAKDSAKSMDAAFAPAIASSIPWVAVLGNHDQEGSLSREGVMKLIVGMKNTLSKFNPPEVECIDGFGNYNLEVGGVESTECENNSVLNLYFFDSGDYSHSNFGFKKRLESFGEHTWMDQCLRKDLLLVFAYFHIPLPEYTSFDSSSFTGVEQEYVGSASVNSGFFTTLVEARDVKAVFTGHGHINDFCGKLLHIQPCYGGGFGYHAYGKEGWPRRARVVVASLENTVNGTWGDVKSIKTWKRLDDEHLTTNDTQILWTKSSVGREKNKLVAFENMKVIASLANTI